MPKEQFDLAATNTHSPLPSSYRVALCDPHWHTAMADEFNALTQNDTWSLVPCPVGVNLVTGKWIFCDKLHPDGTPTWYKARWVVRGFTQ